MTRSLISLLMLVSAVTSFYGCYEDSGGEEVSRQDAALIYSSVYTEVAGAASNAYAEAAYAAEKAVQTGNINYTNSDGSIVVTGDYTHDNAAVTYDYNTEISFNNYTGSGGTVINGSTTFILNMISESNLTYSYVGSFSIIYLGVPYIMSWNMSMTFLNNAYSYIGYFEIDGNRYEYTYTSGGIAALTN